jgi:DnaJ homologue, subfamily C, member 28, conserved domain
MTQRKPSRIRFETWIDRQIRQATERGDFDDLPGSGAPLPGLGKGYDDMWWVKRKLRSENLSYLPPSLALRKEAHEAVEGAARAETEEEVRERIAAINEKIREAIRTGIRGPALNLTPFNTERIVEQWRRARRETR